MIKKSHPNDDKDAFDFVEISIGDSNSLGMFDARRFKRVIE